MKLSDMNDEEFKAHHAKGQAQIMAYSANLDAYVKRVNAVQAMVAQWDEERSKP